MLNKYLYIIFFFFLIVSGCTVIRSNKKIEIEIYNTCSKKIQPERPPRWFTDVLYLRKDGRRYARLMNIKNFNINHAIAVSSKAEENQFKENPSTEDARQLAWENARKHMFDTFLDEFIAHCTRGGSSVIDSASLEQSFYQMITMPNTAGVTPLTVLKQNFTFDACPDSQGYNCYMMAYVRYDELKERMKVAIARLEKEIKEKKEQEKKQKEEEKVRLDAEIRERERQHLDYIDSIQIVCNLTLSRFNEILENLKDVQHRLHKVSDTLLQIQINHQINMQFKRLAEITINNPLCDNLQTNLKNIINERIITLEDNNYNGQYDTIITELENLMNNITYGLIENINTFPGNLEYAELNAFKIYKVPVPEKINIDSIMKSYQGKKNNIAEGGTALDYISISKIINEGPLAAEPLSPLLQSGDVKFQIFISSPHILIVVSGLDDNYYLFRGGKDAFQYYLNNLSSWLIAENSKFEISGNIRYYRLSLINQNEQSYFIIPLVRGGFNEIQINKLKKQYRNLHIMNL
jgi:hypothetical protein